MNAITYYCELFDHVSDADMAKLQFLVTLCAMVWLLWRACKTVFKPTQELINVLGVEVPDVPQVSLADIKADRVDLQWNKPAAHKLVAKYLIQVNGVNGKSAPTSSQAHLLNEITQWANPRVAKPR